MTGTPVDAVVREEAPADAGAVRRVVAAAFGRQDEARLVAALHAGGHARLALVAARRGAVVGHVLLSALPIHTAGGVVPALALAPLAVAPALQGRGLGTRLVEEALARAGRRGHRAVVVLGEPAFYRRFRFSAALASSLESPFAGDAFMALELVPGTLRGVAGRAVYAPPFGISG